MLATLMMGRLRTQLGIELPVRAIFEAPVLQAFARRVEKNYRASKIWKFHRYFPWYVESNRCHSPLPSSGSGSSINWSQGARHI